MYERGYSEGELINFSTCSCVLWQKEQRSGSSELYFCFTCVRASPQPSLWQRASTSFSSNQGGPTSPGSFFILGRISVCAKNNPQRLLTFWERSIWRSSNA